MDPANYELLRNRTLLFFIEKLIDTQTQTDNKKRTLHDLSCQFGSKGFTKEMRQIAGGSQSGLKKFLAEYPSIFAIDGDLVTYHDTSTAAATSTAPTTSTSTSSPHQPITYGTDAANYFRDRLLQYGIGVWVPIKSLLGHRSQAPSEVRHVSGQHLSEFRSFLARFPDTFKIDEPNNTVILTEFANEASTTTTVATTTTPETVAVDLRSALKLVEFFGGVLTNRGGPMMLDQLFHVAASNNMFNNDVIIKTPNDLKSFFHIHNQCFHVTSSMVTLQASYSVGLLHLTQSANKQSTINSAVTSLSPTEHVALKAITKPKPILTTTTDDTNDVTDETTPPTAAAPPTPPTPTTLKTRVSKILLKTLTDNVERDSSSNRTPVINSSPLESLLKSDPFDEEALKSALFSRTVVVSNTRKGKSIIEDLIAGSSPSNPVLLAVDCEGVNLGDPHAGKITQIQITTAATAAAASTATAAASAAAHHQIVYIFDILTQPGLVPDVKTLLQHQHVTKIMHDCRNDSVNLYREHGIRLRNVFDTQAAHVVIQSSTNNGTNDVVVDGNSSDTTSSETSKKVKNISLNNLCSLYCNNSVFNPFKEKIKTTYRHDVRYWSRRPLTRQMISYACCDVLCLPPIHKEMTRRLMTEVSSSSSGGCAQELLEELTEDQILAHIHPDEIRLRRRIRKNEQDLKELKTKIDAALLNNTDIVLSNREMRLLKHLELSDVAKEKLKSSLKVAKKLEKMENKNNPQLLSQQQDSPSDSSLTSLEHIDTTGDLITTKNLNTIDNLQAIIDNIFLLDNNNSSSISTETTTTAGTMTQQQEASTQTHSTGDIVVMNVYKE